MVRILCRSYIQKERIYLPFFSFIFYFQNYFTIFIQRFRYVKRRNACPLKKPINGFIIAKQSQ